MNTPKRSGNGAIAAALIIGLVIGIVAGMMAAGGRQAPAGPAVANGSYEEGYRAAKQKMETLGLLAPEPATLTAVSGQIAEVTADGFLLDVDPSSLNPLVEGAASRRTVKIDADTVVTIRVERDKAAYEKEQADFNALTAKLAAQGPSDTPPPAPPSPYEDRKGSLKDLGKGDRVTVTAAQDIKIASSFTAKEVRSGVPLTALKLVPPEAPRPPELKPGETPCPAQPAPPTSSAPTPTR